MWKDCRRGSCSNGRVLLGEDDSPLPTLLTMMMKYLVGSTGLPGAISYSRSGCCAPHEVG